MPLTKVIGTNNNVVYVPNATEQYESSFEALLYEIWQELLEKLNA